MAINTVDLPELLKYGVLLAFFLITLHELLWFSFGKLELVIDRNYISIKKNYGLYFFKKKFEINAMTNINVLYNVKSNPYIRINMFWSIYAQHKEVLEFEYYGKEKRIGFWALDFDANKAKLLLEKEKTKPARAEKARSDGPKACA